MTRQSNCGDLTPNLTLKIFFFSSFQSVCHTIMMAVSFCSIKLWLYGSTKGWFGGGGGELGWCGQGAGSSNIPGRSCTSPG